MSRFENLRRAASRIVPSAARRQDHPESVPEVPVMEPAVIEWGPSRRARGTGIIHGSLTVEHQYLMYTQWSDGDNAYQQFTDGITRLMLMRRDNAVLDRVAVETKERLTSVRAVRVVVEQEPGRVRATVSMPEGLPVGGDSALVARLHAERAVSWVRAVLSAQRGVVVTAPDDKNQ